ncbi:MAG: hypothetical protein LDLANPLL_01864 [Turneriella sp.]|nr:hypothetical protein [Turneriella sp.]
MQKSSIIITLGAVALLALNCASTPKSKELRDGQGKVIGRYDTISDKEGKANFDLNQNGVFERVSNYKDSQISSVEYYNDASGIQTKTVHFKDGKPASVQVFDKNGKLIRGDVLLDPQQGSAKEVILPEKNKKVIFNGDGTVSVTEIEKK